MTNEQIQQIVITSAVAAAAGGVVSAFVTYFVSRALEQQYGQQIEARLSDAVRALRRPTPVSFGALPRQRIRRGF